MENIQMIPVFHLLFTLQLFVTFIFIFENSQNSFSCGPHFGPFWSVKYLNFGQELPSQSTHDIFLESRHAEVTKNPYYVLSPEWSRKSISSWTRSITKLTLKSFHFKKEENAIHLTS